MSTHPHHAAATPAVDPDRRRHVGKRFWLQARLALLLLSILCVFGGAFWAYSMEHRVRYLAEGIDEVRGEVTANSARLDTIGVALSTHRAASGPAIASIAEMKDELRLARTDNATIIMLLDRIADSLPAKAVDGN